MMDYLDKMNENDAEYKVILIGDTTAGKTSLFKKITSGVFYEKNVSTIGYDRKSMDCEITVEEDGKEVTKKICINLTDTAGQEKYFSITQSYFQGSNGVILIYSIDDKKSFKNLDNWLNMVKNNIGNYEENKYLIFLMGTKLDLVEQDETLRQVTEKDANDFCEKNNIIWFGEWSSKDITQQESNDILAKIAKELYVNIGFNKLVRNTLATLEKKKTIKKKRRCAC